MKHCTANGDLEDFCWLDKGRPNLCWIHNKPEKKEDCRYWEEIERREEWITEVNNARKRETAIS